MWASAFLFRLSVMYQLSDYFYDLPEDRIAHRPADKRTLSRLMHLERKNKKISGLAFADLEEKLHSGDVLVINDTKVIPARLLGKKESGGKVEIFIIDYASGMKNLSENGVFLCQCLVKASKRAKTGQRIIFDDDFSGIVEEGSEGIFRIRFESSLSIDAALEKAGQIPLPPYIKRDEAPDSDDLVSYQTVYASKKGAVAAPTAGLHFTPEFMARLEKRGVRIARITLHVGYGTFVPVRCDDIRDHRMHSEWFEIPEETAGIINSAKKSGSRVIAVGTTSVRTLEFAASGDGALKPSSGYCDIFIYPGYRFRAVDAILTNFHLPESTLLMLVSAFAGRDFILEAYREAIKEKYRFFSYGDAMLIT